MHIHVNHFCLFYFIWQQYRDVWGWKCTSRILWEAYNVSHLLRFDNLNNFCFNFHISCHSSVLLGAWIRKMDCCVVVVVGHVIFNHCMNWSKICLWPAAAAMILYTVTQMSRSSVLQASSGLIEIIQHSIFQQPQIQNSTSWQGKKEAHRYFVFEELTNKIKD